MTVAVGIADTAVVAHRGVEVAVGSEGELAAVVASELVGNREQNTFAGRVDDRRVGDARCEPCDHAIFGGVDVVNEQLFRGRVIGVESQAEQAFDRMHRDLAGEIEKRLVQDPVGVGRAGGRQDVDQALEDADVNLAVARRGDRSRAAEAGRHLHQLDVGQGTGRRGRRGEGTREPRQRGGRGQ